MRRCEARHFNPRQRPSYASAGVLAIAIAITGCCALSADSDSQEKDIVTRIRESPITRTGEESSWTHHDPKVLEPVVSVGMTIDDCEARLQALGFVRLLDESTDLTMASDTRDYSPAPRLVTLSSVRGMLRLLEWSICNRTFGKEETGDELVDVIVRIAVTFENRTVVSIDVLTGAVGL
jgi:hypothetical protein